GDVTVTLPATGAYDVEIDGGVGEVVVRLPRALEARVSIDEGVGEVSVPAGFTRAGDTHTSAGYATATARADIDIDGGVGRVRLERIDELAAGLGSGARPQASRAWSASPANHSPNSVKKRALAASAVGFTASSSARRIASAWAG